MGYIAPITQYQYMQYHERVRAKGKKLDPYPINSVQKISLNSNHDYNSLGIKNNPLTIEKITGKGRHFSEYV
ncbi:hypothetical protein [Lederbergia citri]|uniref:Uncharacterized protein n=1 Tax=Lederbergia citri TaxID=2833580 RepID=A0A942TBW5_9BACI|nr:hypothetical protein [Lederbergia citri]MBS4193674.1 hypothetical protein [Lederbergia citri]